MLIKQESLTEKMSFKDLPNNSPLPFASLVLVFGSVKRFSDNKLIAQLKQRFPVAQIIGCTTSGEIHADGVFDNSLQITAIVWEKVIQRITHRTIDSMQSSFDTGYSLANEIKSPSLRTVLVFSDGLNVSGSELLQGFQSILGDVPIVGGMAGDQAEFVKTLQMLNATVSDKMIIAIGLYGNDLITATGALGGWKPYGPPRKITKSVKNVVYEMDGKPALPLYKLYIGDAYAKYLPSSGLKFPLAIIEDGKNEVEKIRTLLAVDTTKNSLTFAGNVEEGESVRFCQSSHESLVEGASRAAHMIMEALDTNAMQQTGLALCVSCVGRKGVMADLCIDEINAVKKVFGSQTHLSGFYSYGEFAPRSNAKINVLHNQTMTIGYLSERL